MARAIVDHFDGILVEREILTDRSEAFNLVIEGNNGNHLARVRTNALTQGEAAHLARLLAERVIGIEAT